MFLDSMFNGTEDRENDKSHKLKFSMDLYASMQYSPVQFWVQTAPVFNRVAGSC
jgi:hypothetical protein